MAGSTSPTAKTTASRCSTATANGRRSGTTCTGRTACASAHGQIPLCYIGEGGPAGEINETGRISARASASTRSRAKVLARLGKTRAACCRAVHLAARHRRRQPGQHLCRRTLRPLLVALLERPAPQSAASSTAWTKSRNRAISVDRAPAQAGPVLNRLAADPLVPSCAGTNVPDKITPTTLKPRPERCFRNSSSRAVQPGGTRQVVSYSSTMQGPGCGVRGRCG